MSTQPPHRLLVPRPQAQGEAFAVRLEAEAPGLCECTVAPLIRIDLLRPSLDLDGIDALVFTSANGIRGFAALSDRRDLPVYVVGGTTAATATAAGFEVAMAAATVLALVPLLPGGSLLYARGVHVSHDLASDPASGGRIREAIVYDQPAQSLSASTKSALLRGEFSGVTLFSARTAERLADELGNQSLPKNTYVFQISNAVAAMAAPLGGTSVVAETPDGDGLIGAITTIFRR